MIELKEIIFLRENEKYKNYKLNDKVIILTGEQNTGKSSFILLIYILLGSKNSNKIFKIINNPDFDIKIGDEYELLFEYKDSSGNKETISHKVKVEDKNGIKKFSFWMNNKKSTIDKFKANYNYYCSTYNIEFPDYSSDYSLKNNNQYTITKYTLNSFFRAFKDLNNILNFGKNKQLNTTIKNFLYDDDIENRDLKKRKYNIELKIRESVKIKNKLLYLSEEFKSVNDELKMLNNSKKIDEKYIKNKMELIKNREIIKLNISDLDSTSNGKSFYLKKIELINKLMFENKELEDEFKNFLLLELKKEDGILKNIVVQKRELKKIEEEILEINNKIENPIKNIEKRETYLSLRLIDIKEQIKIQDKYGRGDLNKIILELQNYNAELKKINEKINNMAENKSKFIKKAQHLLKNNWKDNYGKYIDLKGDFKLVRKNNANTTSELIDKIISFIVILENAYKKFKEEEIFPDLITINNLITASDERDDKKIIEKIIEPLYYELNKLKNNNITIIIQDKKAYFSKWKVNKINFDKDNPFNKKI